MLCYVNLNQNQNTIVQYNYLYNIVQCSDIHAPQHQQKTKGSDDEMRQCCKKVFYRMKEKMNRTKEETSVVKLIMKKQDERVPPRT